MRALLLTAPLLALLGLAYFVPFLGVVRWSFTLPKPGLEQYRALLTDPLVQSVFMRTARICAVVTVASVTTAYAICYVWVRSGDRPRSG